MRLSSHRWDKAESTGRAPRTRTQCTRGATCGTRAPLPVAGFWVRAATFFSPPSAPHTSVTGSGCRRRRPALLRRRPTPLLHRRRGRGRWPAAGGLALGAELRGVPRPLAKARDGPPLAGLRALLSARRRAAASGRGRAGRIFPLRRPRLLHLHRLQLAAAAAATVATRRAASLRVRLAGGRDRHRGGRPGVDRDGRGAVGGPLCARERPAAGVDLLPSRGSARRERRWRSGDRLPPPLHHHHAGSRFFCARERREAGRRSSSPPWSGGLNCSMCQTVVLGYVVVGGTVWSGT